MRILISFLLVFIPLGNSVGNSLAVQHTPVAAVETISPEAAQKTLPPVVKKAPSVTFKSLTQMNELIELGVPALALSLLHDEQKKRPAFSAD